MMAICLSMIFGEMMMIQKMLNREPTRQRRMENLKGKNPDHLHGRHPGRGLARGIERRDRKDRDPEVLLEVPGPEVVLEVVESLVAGPGEALHQVPHQDLQEGLAEATHGQGIWGVKDSGDTILIITYYTLFYKLYTPNYISFKPSIQTTQHYGIHFIKISFKSKFCVIFF